MFEATGHIRANVGLETPDDISAALEAAGRARQQSRQAGSIARIRIYDTIEPRASLWTLLFGGTAADIIAAEFAAAVNDPQVSGILLDIDSPGGSVYGIPELARQIRAARGIKPILAAITEGASAAYYLASQADQVSTTPSGQVGSIGVIYVHTDLTGMADAQGAKFTIFRSQDRKADINPYETLTPEAASDIQAKVDAYDAMFVNDVAAGRGVTADKVRADYGQGRMLLAADALAAGLIDRIETIDEAIARLAGGGVPARQAAKAESLETGPIELSAERLARSWQLAKWRIPALAGATPGGK